MHHINNQPSKETNTNMAKQVEQSAISFDPTTFSSGRWDGGRGTVAAEPTPYCAYRVIKGNKGDFTVVEAHFSVEDQEGEAHDVKWQMGYADNIVIRESNDPDSDEAEQGPSIFAREPGKQIRLRASEEWSQLVASLQTQGYPSAKLGKGDLTVFAGLDADWVQFARKKDDKYPILVVGEIFDGKASKSKSAPAPVGAKAKPAAKPAVKEEEPEGDAEETALAIALEALADAEDATGNGTTVGDVVRIANKKLKGNPALRKEVLDLVGSDPAEKGAWIKSQTEFKYKKSTNSIVLVED